MTSPKDYRNRFRVAMSKYILLAPSCWHLFQASHIFGRQVQLVSRDVREDEGNSGSLLTAKTEALAEGMVLDA